MEWNFIVKIHAILIVGQANKTMSEDRKMYKCTCSDCGKDSEVPFEPKEGRPVYCRECLPKHRSRRF
jgi:CxxC-x17-CxxC domain-containing protein